MLVVSRGAVLVAVASAAGGLLAGPSAAYATDTSTSLSAAEMATALKAVSAASARAAARGWKGAVKLSGSPVSGSESLVVDPVHGVEYERLSFGGQALVQYLVAGKGMYTGLPDAASRAAVKMMRRPSVRYVFTSDRSVKLGTGLADSGVSPATVLADGVEPAGTRTVHDDGSADYRLDQDGTTMTAHVTAAGVLASAEVDGDGVHAVLTYAYGPQHPALPPAWATIGAAALAGGVAYLGMAAEVKQVAGQSATDVLKAAHGRTISVSSLRTVVRRDVRAADAVAGVKMIKADDVRGGVRVHATNPWTHRTVSYTLRPSGRKVTIAAR